MPWILRLRGDATAPILAEYECPVHGRFEITVPRPAPDAAPCPAAPDEGCAMCGALDGERCDPWCPRRLVTCGLSSPWRFPLPRVGVKHGEVVTGKVMDYPPSNVCLDTRALADDPSPSGYAKWKDKQMAITRDEGLRRARSGRR